MCGRAVDGWRTDAPTPHSIDGAAFVARGASGAADDAPDAADAVDGPPDDMLVPVDVVVGSSGIGGEPSVAVDVSTVAVGGAGVVVSTATATDAAPDAGDDAVHISDSVLSMSSSIAGRGESAQGDCSRDVESRSSSSLSAVPVDMQNKLHSGNPTLGGQAHARNHTRSSPHTFTLIPAQHAVRIAEQAAVRLHRLEQRQLRVAVDAEPVLGVVDVDQILDQLLVGFAANVAAAALQRTEHIVIVQRIVDDRIACRGWKTIERAMRK